MREEFSGFYFTGNDAKELWAKAFFSFDANVLLDLYRYKPETRSEHIRQMRALKGRIWLTHQAALEYQRNRRRVIARYADERYNQATEAVSRAYSTLKKDLKDFATAEYHPIIDPDRILGDFEKARSKAHKYLGGLRKKHLEYLTRDPIRHSLDGLFKDRVGKTPSPVEIAALEDEAARRVRWQTPPGYRDLHDESGRLGDPIIWLQLLDEAKDRAQPCIFITNDAKDDWWDTSTEPPEPRPQLRQEMLDRAGVEFWMYSATNFIRTAQEIYEASTDERTAAAIREIDEVQKQRLPTAWPTLPLGLRRLIEEQAIEASGSPETIAWIAALHEQAARRGELGAFPGYYETFADFLRPEWDAAAGGVPPDSEGVDDETEGPNAEGNGDAKEPD